mmetsp:Transcript_21486/g.20767  ORF Transcript_21486/g.20767 Transcript_21486/m.20767 type:complete len:285 (-) Transcript_21486:127-981(-)
MKMNVFISRCVASILVLLHNSIGFNINYGVHRYNVLSQLRSSLLESEDIMVNDLGEIPGRRKTAAIKNTVGMNISASNFFGNQCFSIKEAKKELIGLLLKEIEIEEEFLDYRVEYLTKYLEYKYIPIQTIPFLNFALSGTWSMLYSNILRSRADNTLLYKISQEINPSDTEGGGDGGTVDNIIGWELDRPDDKAYGDLIVKCSYRFNTKGDLDVSLIEHLLKPKDESPKDVEDLIMSIQKSIPFESFDPDEILVHNTYIDPDIRISRINGEKFENVVNIFIKNY